jgi:hypothetical protein
VRSSLSIVVALGCALVAGAARAELEVTADLAVGGGVVLSDDPEIEPQGGYDTTLGVARVGLSTSFVFLRESNREVGLGVYAEIVTSSFLDVMPGAGFTLVLPINHAAPLVVFAGAHYEYDGTHAGGFGGRLWWGAHNHNHTGVYNGTIGLWAEVRGNVWGDHEVIVAGGVDLDLMMVFTPWIWFARYLRGPARL